MADLLRRLVRTPQGAIGLGLVVLVLVLALVGPFLAPHAPDALSPLRRYRPPGPDYWLGTDQLGRDILSRLLAGAREMLPNVVAPVIVEASIRVAFAVMLFATLSFLGLGAQPPASEWGLMVSEARRFMHLSPWMILWPCLAIALVAIGFNLLGDGLRDALNPRT